MLSSSKKIKSESDFRSGVPSAPSPVELPVGAQQGLQKPFFLKRRLEMEDASGKHKAGHLTRRDAGFKRRRKVVRKALAGLFIDRMEQNEIPRQIYEREGFSPYFY